MLQGTAKFHNKEAYLTWYQTLSREDACRYLNIVKNHQKTSHVTGPGSCASAMFDTWEGAFSAMGKDFVHKRWIETREKYLQTIQEFLSVSDLYDIPLRIGEWYNEEYAFLYMGNAQKGIIVPDPDKYVTYIPDPDYKDMSPAQVRSSLLLDSGAAQMDLIPGEANNLTVNNVAEKKVLLEQEIENLKAKMQDVLEARSGNLAKIRAEIEKKQAALERQKEALMAEFRRQKAEAEKELEKLELQLHMLDAQIYQILCFAGEVVNFKQLRYGRNAPDDYPIVVHQKLHFLDEDLARLASIYDIQWNDLHLFEELLKFNPVAFETFTPNDRCISLVRLSKDGTTLGESIDMPFQNLLQRYEYCHGTTVGILIRNGENLYLGWTDETRVDIKDDLILTPGKVEYQPGPMPEFRFPSEEERWIREQKAIRRKLLDGFISRSFVYNILQGVVENSKEKILPLPAGVTLGRQSEYVAYSLADAWITDNRFGSFTEIVELCNQKVHKGDMILTVQHLIAEHDFNRRWNDTYNNVRGRGEANRTHDVAAEDCTLYPINLVEYDEPVPMIRYKYPWRDPLEPKKEPVYYESTVRAANASLPEDAVILDRYDHVERHVFVSLHKRYSYSGQARANFEIHDSEFINLTFMNSIWLEWVITNKTLGGWTIKGKVVNYAYAIRYLKKALDHVRKREEQEKALLDAVDPSVCAVPEWQLKLSEWKFQNNVREITAYQAKRFVKSLE